MRRGLTFVCTLLLGTALGSSACAPSVPVASDEAAIQGGARVTAFPAVGVVRLSLAQSFCSGTLIAPDVVLTAAHCIEAEGEKVDAFFTGSGKASPDDATDPGTLGMVRHEVVEQVRFPTFEYFFTCPNPDLDIALVRLKEPLSDVEPMALGDAPASGASCTAVGFGAHDEGGVTTFLEKRAAKVEIVDVRETSLDVTGDDGNADRGDSGGPLLCDGVLVATTSCVPDYPPDAVAYGNLTTALPWIRAMTAAWDPATAADGSRPTN